MLIGSKGIEERRKRNGGRGGNTEKQTDGLGGGKESFLNGKKGHSSGCMES